MADDTIAGPAASGLTQPQAKDFHQLLNDLEDLEKLRKIVGGELQSKIEALQVEIKALKGSRDGGGQLAADYTTVRKKLDDTLSPRWSSPVTKGFNDSLGAPSRKELHDCPMGMCFCNDYSEERSHSSSLESEHFPIHSNIDKDRSWSPTSTTLAVDGTHEAMQFENTTGAVIQPLCEEEWPPSNKDEWPPPTKYGPREHPGFYTETIIDQPGIIIGEENKTCAGLGNAVVDDLIDL